MSDERFERKETPMRNSRPEAFICDLDGTLALPDPAAPRGWFEWERIPDDIPNPPIQSLVLRMAADAWPIFMTARPLSAEQLTRSWLNAHLPPLMGQFQLLMRLPGDEREDFEVKLDLYRSVVRPSWAVSLVLEDRDQCVKAWRTEGVTCLQVCGGDY